MYVSKSFIRKLIQDSTGVEVPEAELDRMMEKFSRELSETNRQKKALHRRKMEYRRQAKSEAEKGNPFHHLLALANRMKLERFEVDFGRDFEIEITGSCCEACDELAEGGTWTVEEAMQSSPLPRKRCTRFSHVEGYVQGWCICGYHIAT